MAAATVSTPNFTITESVSPYITCGNYILDKCHSFQVTYNFYNNIIGNKKSHILCFSRANSLVDVASVDDYGMDVAGLAQYSADRCHHGTNHDFVTVVRAQLVAIIIFFSTSNR